jgi:prophage regulatory protein
MLKIGKLASNKELESVFGIPYCFAHIQRLEDAGEFPKRLRLGACRVAWFEDEISDWIAERAARRGDSTQLHLSF